MTKLEKPPMLLVQDKDRERLLDVELQKIWSQVLTRYPVLSRVEIIIPSADSSLVYTGGEFLLPDDENPDPAIVILPADISVYEKLKETRAPAIKIAADLLGRPFGEMSGEDIKQFIFLHEVGHTYDFIVNFEANSRIGEKDAVRVWSTLFVEQMNSLPVPGLDPNDLKIALGGIQTLSEFINIRPTLGARIKRLNIDTVEELLVAQELAYRNTPKESFADQFAAQFLKSYVAI